MRGVTTPIRLFSVVLLPAPLRPSSATTSLRSTRSDDVEQDVRIAVIAVQPVDLEQAHVEHSVHAAEIGFLHLGVALDLLRRAFDQHAAFLQHGDALGQLEQRIHVVVDDDHGAALR